MSRRTRSPLHPSPDEADASRTTSSWNPGGNSLGVFAIFLTNTNPGRLVVNHTEGRPVLVPKRVLDKRRSECLLPDLLLRIPTSSVDFKYRFSLVPLDKGAELGTTKMR